MKHVYRTLFFNLLSSAIRNQTSYDRYTNAYMTGSGKKEGFALRGFSRRERNILRNCGESIIKMRRKEVTHKKLSESNKWFGRYGNCSCSAIV